MRTVDRKHDELVWRRTPHIRRNLRRLAIPWIRKRILEGDQLRLAYRKVAHVADRDPLQILLASQYGPKQISHYRCRNHERHRDIQRDSDVHKERSPRYAVRLHALRLFLLARRQKF